MDFKEMARNKRPVCSKCYQALVPRPLECQEVAQLLGGCWIDYISEEWKCLKCGNAFLFLTPKSD